MDTFSSPMELRGAIAGYLINFGQTLPEHTRNHLQSAQAMPSPVDMIVNTMESLYAGLADLNDEGKTLCGQCGYMVSENAWHGKADRANGIYKAARRELGETTTPAASSDPEPEAQFMPPPPPPEET